MEGLESIKNKILADARQEAQEISQQANQVISDMMKQNRTDCERIVQEAVQQAENNAKTSINRAQSLAALDQRKAVLLARQTVIEQALDQALEQLSALPEAKKEALYADLISRSGLARGQLVFNEKDQAIGKRLAERFAPDLTLSPQTAAFAGGLIVRQERVEENMTFETLMKNKRPEWVKLAADLLFADQADDSGAAARDKS